MLAREHLSGKGDLRGEKRAGKPIETVSGYIMSGDGRGHKSFDL